MVATTVLVMGIVVAVMLLVGLALIARSRAGVPHAVRGPNNDTSWMPAIYGDGGSSDCGAGDAGCDGGGGGGGGD